MDELMRLGAAQKSLKKALVWMDNGVSVRQRVRLFRGGRQGRIGNPIVFARDPYKIQLAASNFGRVDIDWTKKEVALRLHTPHEQSPSTGDVAAETIVRFDVPPTL